MIDKKKSPPEFSELKEWCEHISSGTDISMTSGLLTNQTTPRHGLPGAT